MQSRSDPRRHAVPAIAAATVLIGVSHVRAQCTAGCASECGGREAVYGQVTYADIDHGDELAADGITSSCCDRRIGQAGCDDASCEAVVCAVASDCCSVEWVESCADLARELCTDLSSFNGCIGRTSSIFVRGMQEGDPVPYVTVELVGGGLCGVVDKDIADSSGCFCLCVGNTGCGTPNTLRVNAENHHVTVKESKIVAHDLDAVISVDFDIDGSLYGTGNVNYGTVGIDDDLHTFANAWSVTPISRALHVCRAAHVSAEHIAALAGSFGDTHVVVRLGYYSTAWYDAYLSQACYLLSWPLMVCDNDQVIHLPGADAGVMWHEYGHHLENRLGAFGVIPSYILHGWVPGGATAGHNLCCEQVTTGGGWDYCWSFLEGVASWYGAVNGYGFTNVAGVEFYGDPPDIDGDGLPDWTTYGALYSLGDNFRVETSGCGSQGTARGDCDGDGIADSDTWAEPRAVEAITANVLWDLVDANVDQTDTHATGVPEVAEVPINDVLDVLMATTSHSNNCAWVTTYTHPVTLEDFCNEYKDQRRNDTPHGVFPDLYAAYAFNIADVACARDDSAPGAVTMSSSTHPENQWRNTDQVVMMIDDGPDDMSGSYYYWDLWDTNSTADLSATSTIGTESFASKSTTNSTTTTRPEGDDNYYHVQTRDLAGRLGPITSYGPVKIDVTLPQFVTPTVFPPPGPPYAIGTFVNIEWDTTDICPSGCVPSGVEYIVISYDDGLGGGIIYPAIYEATGSTDIYLDPDVYRPTSSGRFSVTAVDRATNQNTETSDALDIVQPFDGPYSIIVDGITFAGMRTVSGDIDFSGTDEVVLTRAQGGTPSLWLIRVFPSMVASYIGNGFLGGDLFLADTDRDGDLDLIGAGNYGSAGGPSYQVQHRLNTGGGFGTPTTLLVPGYDNMRTRVVDLYGNGDPILVFTGLAGPGNPALGVYNFGTLMSTNGLPGVVPVDGDFEVGDIDADGDFDFVMAGTDASGTASVVFYEGLGATWIPHTVEILPTIDHVDVDLGNWDDDREVELFVMYETQAGPVVSRHTRLYEWFGAERFVRATTDSEEAVIAQGDGHIVDIYSDGLSEVFAMGSPPGALGWQLAHQDTGVFGSGLPPTPRSNVRTSTDTAWGDFDADFSLDLFLAGRDATGRVAEWYRNLMSDHGAPNTAPNRPTNPSSTYDTAAGGYTFRWEPPSLADETAAAALGYELRVGTSSAGAPGGGNEIISWAHPAGPSQQVAAARFGGQLERFVPLPLGTYYWSVRTVDSGWKRSVPVPEQITLASPGPDCSTIPGDCNTNSLADACETDTDHDGAIDDCDADDDNDGVLDVADINPLDPDVCEDQDGDGCDDCSIGTDDYGSLPDNDPARDGVDTDGDGACDASDPCPTDSPDDTDGDGVCDSNDVCPGFDDTTDLDSDGAPDMCDSCPQDDPDDTDGDGVCDSADACPGSDDSLDADGDGTPDDCDACPLSAGGDSDGDGVCDYFDLCPGGDDNVDTDGDGFADACDACPNDNPNDSDYDAVCDSDDVCANGDDFTDADADGTPDYCEDCNSNGILDGPEILAGTATDMNVNNVPDDCEIGTIIDTIWTCGTDSWSTTGCWSVLDGIDAYPNNTPVDYSVTLPDAAYTVTVDLVSVTISAMTATGMETGFVLAPGVSFGVTDSLTAKGTLRSHGTFSVSAPAASVDVGGTDLVATGGGSIDLPIASYAGSMGPDSELLKADLAGSVLSLPNLATIDGSTNGHVAIMANAGGGVLMPQLASMAGEIHILAQTNGFVELERVDLSTNGLVDMTTGAELRLLGSMVFAMTDPARFTWTGGATLSMLATSGGGPCPRLEAAGEDVSNSPGGWISNFQLDRLVIGTGAQVRLADDSDNGNRTGGAAEAVYVDTLEFADANGRLWLSGIHIYYNSLVGQPAQIVRFGDGDGDCDIDLTDHAVFVDCMAGPGATPNPTPPTSTQECLDMFDSSGDFDVDADDFAGFQLVFGGP